MKCIVKNSIASLAILFLSASALAYVPSARMIVDKMVAHNGKPLVSIEQDVQILAGAETLSFHETWLIDSDKNLKVTVTGLGPLKDKFRVQYLYTANQKWVHEAGKEKTNQTISNDFMDRLFFVRSGEELAEYMIRLKFAPAGFYTKKPYTVSRGTFIYEPEPFLKLARQGGRITYNFTENYTGIEKSSGLWVEQDRFVIRKVRMPSMAELYADDYAVYDNNLHLAKAKQYSWSGYRAQVKVTAVNARDNKALAGLQPSSVEQSYSLETLKSYPAGAAAVEFYSRFR